MHTKILADNQKKKENIQRGQQIYLNR